MMERWALGKTVEQYKIFLRFHLQRLLSSFTQTKRPCQWKSHSQISYHMELFAFYLCGFQMYDELNIEPLRCANRVPSQLIAYVIIMFPSSTFFRAGLIISIPPALQTFLNRIMSLFSTPETWNSIMFVLCTKVIYRLTPAPMAWNVGLL